MPAFNEAKTIQDVVARVQAVPLDLEIVLVNDASSDGTAGIVDDLASSTVRVLHHAVNRGKGAAIRTALDAATGDMVVIQDADLEYDPNDLVQLMAPLADGTAEVVYGVRSLHSQRLIMRLGNRFVTLLANLLYGQRLQDMETCYKMMCRELAQSLDLECRRFDVEAEITAKVLRSGYAIHEMPISYTARYENKKLSPLDGLPTVQALWRYRKWKPGVMRET
jgi:glycosyltransferase involved in cell wall biosynthesis